MMTLTACGGGSGDGAKSTNGQPINYNNNGYVNNVGTGVVLTPGPALQTPYSTGRSVTFLNTRLGAEFNKDSSGLATLVQGELELGQPFGFDQDCWIPSGDYALSTKAGGQQASNVKHHYKGIVINAVGPVSFTATITNVSANDSSGTWKMQGAFSVLTVGNRSCTGFAIPMLLDFTY